MYAEYTQLQLTFLYNLGLCRPGLDSNSSFYSCVSYKFLMHGIQNGLYNVGNFKEVGKKTKVFYYKKTDQQNR